LRRGVRPVVRRVAVSHRALAVRDVAEGVEDVGELGRRAARVDVLHVVVAGVDAPVGEVPDDLVAAAGAAGGRTGDGVAVRRLAAGVVGTHGVGVRGAGAEAADGGAGAADLGPLGRALVDAVAGDGAGGGVPRQGDRVVVRAGDAQVGWGSGDAGAPGGGGGHGVADGGLARRVVRPDGVGVRGAGAEAADGGAGAADLGPLGRALEA